MPIGVHAHDRCKTLGEPANALKLVGIVILASHLDQDCLVHTVLLHLEQQAFDWFVPILRNVTVTIDNSHGIFLSPQDRPSSL